MSCSEALRVHAYFDGELDASAAAEVERHLETCPDCAMLLKDLEISRSSLRESAPYYRASDALRARIADALDGESGERLRPARIGKGFVWGAMSGGGATAMAAVLAFFLFLPVAPNLLVDDLTNAHLRSMMSDHLIDVVSSDRHTVKPWFNGRLSLSPPVPDLADQEFPLVGGRLDYIGEQSAACLVYRRHLHIINLCIWPGDGASAKLPAATERHGYTLLSWQQDHQMMTAISDVNRTELEQFKALWIDRSRDDTNSH